MFCTNCGKQLEPGAEYCTSCGAKVGNVPNEVNQNMASGEPVNTPQSDVVVMPTNVNNSMDTNTVNNADTTQPVKDVKSTISLIIGIVAIILSFFLNVLMLPLGIVGLILGLISKEKGGKKIAGIVLNIISIIIPIAIIALIYVYRNDIEDFIEEYTPSVADTTDNLKGEWQATDGHDYYVIEDGKFYWYKSYLDLNDNYWYGDVKYYHGEDGFKKAGMTSDQIESLKSYESENISLDNSYLVIFTPRQIISGGVDKTSTNLEEGTIWKYIWLIDGDDALVMNSGNADFGYYKKVN